MNQQQPTAGMPQQSIRLKPSVANVLPPSQREVMPELNLSYAEMERIRHEMKEGKKKSGIILLIILVLLYLGTIFLNSKFFHSTGFLKWSTLIFLGFFVPTLFTRFQILSIMIDKFAPFLREPEDFLKRGK